MKILAAAIDGLPEQVGVLLQLGVVREDLGGLLQLNQGGHQAAHLGWKGRLNGKFLQSYGRFYLLERKCSSRSYSSSCLSVSFHLVGILEISVITSMKNMTNMKILRIKTT